MTTSQIWIFLQFEMLHVLYAVSSIQNFYKLLSAIMVPIFLIVIFGKKNI